MMHETICEAIRITRHGPTAVNPRGFYLVHFPFRPIQTDDDDVQVFEFEAIPCKAEDEAILLRNSLRNLATMVRDNERKLARRRERRRRNMQVFADMLIAVSRERDALLKKVAKLEAALARPMQEQLEREADEAAADLAACPEARWAENRRLEAEFKEPNDAPTR